MTAKSGEGRELVDFRKKLSDVVVVLGGNPHSVHFIIAKWDILANDGIGLDQTVDVTG
jgi:hypothetical protein